MASAIVKARCITCGKEKATSKCGGCLQDFCYKHLGDHRQELSKDLDGIEVMRDVFRQTINGKKSDPEKHLLIQQIDEWEQKSIKIIRQTADERRQLVFDHRNAHFTEIETKLNKLTEQLRQSRKEEDFFESDLRQWNEELTQLKEKLVKFTKITLQQDQAPLINKIFVNVSSHRVLLHSINIAANARWLQNGTTIVGGTGKGSELNQLNSSMGIFVDDDQTVYVADSENDRVVEWKRDAKNGQIVAGGNGKGSQNDQLNYPTNVIVDKENDYLIICDCENRRLVRWPRRMGASGETLISAVHCHDLAIDDNGYVYVSDIDKHEVRRWRIGDTNGTIVAGGNGKGSRLDQLDTPRYIFVDQNRSVYVSDWNNHRVMKWIEGAKEGAIVAGGRGQGNGFTQFNYPRGIVGDQSDTVYVVDNSNHRIMRWTKGSTQGSVVVGNRGGGKQANQLRGPTGLSFDRHGNLYVPDCENYQIQKFNIDSNSSS